MFFSFNFIKDAYEGLIKLDTSEGKSRQEKISGLRHLLATSELLHQEDCNEINLKPDSEFRQQFITAVGNVVALNDQGLYSADFANLLKPNLPGSVSSNFLTTGLLSSRHADRSFPNRPKPLLELTNEHASIHPNVKENLINSYHLKNIQSELCIWLLRNEDFGTLTDTPTPKELLLLLTNKLNGI